MTEKIVIVGIGGFGREVHDVVDAINAEHRTWEVIGYVDENASDVNRELVGRRGFDVLGDLSVLADLRAVRAVIGIGSGAARRHIDGQLTQWGVESATLVHPAATLGYDVRLGPGSVICAGARLTTNISLGRHVHVNINSTVGHDSVLANYVTVNPLVAVSGWVEIGEEAMLGTHSAILQNLTVGPRSIVGAGSCVVRDVPTDTVVKGVPAR